MIFTLNQYNRLQMYQKAVVVCSECTLLDMIFNRKVICTLYSYSSYYIEVRVDNSTKDLMDIRAFKDGKKLEKYLDKINLLHMIND